MNQRCIESPIGTLLIGAKDGKLVQVRLMKGGEEPLDAFADDPVLDMAQRQLAQYFAGERTTFELPLSMQGTAFEQAVWKALLEILLGEISSYGALAKRLGKPAASRAVGRACSQNPLLIVIPCHRVVASSGKLTGFAAGLDAKRTLLMLEGWTIGGDRIKNK